MVFGSTQGMGCTCMICTRLRLHSSASGSVARAFVAELFNSGDPAMLQTIRGSTCCIGDQELYVVSGEERRSLAKLFLAEISSSPVPRHLLPNTYLITVQAAPTRLRDLTPEQRGGPTNAWIIFASSAEQCMIFMDALSRGGPRRSAGGVLVS